MYAKKNPLGKGLSALLENYDTDVSSTYTPPADLKTSGIVSFLSLDCIETNPFQPRTDFDEKTLQELSESIKEVGLVQPVTVRKMGYDRYQIISGERRFIASKMAGLTEIPVFIRVADDKEMLQLALVENIQRQDLDAIEIAIAYKRLIEECNLSHEDLSRKMGKDRSTVTNYLRLLKLPAVIQLALKQRKIAMAHARTLLGVDDIAKQLELFHKIMDQELSVRDIETIVKKTKNRIDDPNTSSANYSDVKQKFQSQLSSKFGTKVKLHVNNKWKGEIVIPFESEEQLRKIAGLLS